MSLRNLLLDQDENTWKCASDEDLWIFDKLILSRKLGYTCGPAGVDVPEPGTYIVRPCVNLLGMGAGASMMRFEKSTDHLPPGYFWCEVFTGRHLSVDYVNGKQTLCVEGFREATDPLYRWKRWQRVNDVVPYPSILTKYRYLNCEFIGGRLIEVHLRLNPDFHNRDVDVMYPVWDDQEIQAPEGMVFIPDPDGPREGFYIKAPVV